MKQTTKLINEARWKAILTTTLVCVLASLVSASPTISSTPTPPLHHATVLKNPHLKGVEHTEARTIHPAKTKTQVAVHQPWHRRWDYQKWIVLHRGLGTIRGFVHGPTGGAIADAKVWLRHANGAAIRLVSRKHITYADADGNFIMSGVRAGKYRVVAVRGKLRGHIVTAVHPGLAAEVSVKI
jgi:hypothetical protein